MKHLTALRGKTGLVVEDDGLLGVALAEHLKEAGADVVLRTSAATALSTILSQTIDFAVVDFRLRDEASVSVQVELERRAIPYVLLTGYPPAAVRRSENQTILSKPVSAAQLVSSLARLLGAG